MRTAIAAAVAAVALTVGLVGLVASGSDEDGESGPTTTTSIGPLTAAQRAEQGTTHAWEQKAEAAFGGAGLTGEVTALVTGAREWLAGQRDTARFGAELDTAERRFSGIADAVARLEPFTIDRRVNTLYRVSAALYRESVHVYQSALGTEPGPLRDQLDRLGRRVRTLADRVFDRGLELVRAHLYVPASPDVDIRLPEEVPNWVAEGLAPGPPLDDEPGPAATEPPMRQDRRPSQPRAQWKEAVVTAAAPTAGELAAAIETRDPVRLRELARRLVGAVEFLRRVPDPGRDRELGARVRLSLLLHADAARAAQAAAYLANPTDGDRLDEVARRAAAAGDTLWAADLGERDTGFELS